MYAHADLFFSVFSPHHVVKKARTNRAKTESSDFLHGAQSFDCAHYSHAFQIAVAIVTGCHLLVPPQAVYVMPSTSGRTQTYPRASDKVPFFLELKALREELKARGAVQPS